MNYISEVLAKYKKKKIDNKTKIAQIEKTIAKYTNIHYQKYHIFKKSETAFKIWDKKLIDQYIKLENLKKMIKDKLHTITDEDAIAVAEILLKAPQLQFYNFIFEKIFRRKYDLSDGMDAEETVEIHFDTALKGCYNKKMWMITKIIVQLVESAAYCNYPHLRAICLYELEKSWKLVELTNHIEAIEYLKNRELV